jgi:hypothetical protein
LYKSLLITHANNKINKMFDYHLLNEQGKYEVVKFKTILGEAVFFGTKAIAQKDGNFSDKKRILIYNLSF